jgi:thymidylate synthase
MNPHDETYNSLIRNILETGIPCSDRTGVGTTSIFGCQLRFDLQQGFPAITTKRLAWRALVGELLWFLEGSTDERRLAEITYNKDRSFLADKTTIWTANANKQGVELGYPNDDEQKELGPVYGVQWRKFRNSKFDIGVDQIDNAIQLIKNEPNSRRIVVSAWNPSCIPREEDFTLGVANIKQNIMALPPCHYSFQFRVLDDRLYCIMNMRSTDVMLGLPFNIASYALLTHIIARECELEVGDLVISIGDAHIYNNHVEGAMETLSRTPYESPTLLIAEDFNLYSVLQQDTFSETHKFQLHNYMFHPAIKMEMAV